MDKVISLCKERRKRQGKRTPLPLLGLSASADSILKASLAVADETERLELLNLIGRGTYRDMLVELSARFEIVTVGNARAAG